MPESGVKLILPTMSPTKLASVVTIGGGGLGLGLGLGLLRRRDCGSGSGSQDRKNRKKETCAGRLGRALTAAEAVAQAARRVVFRSIVGWLAAR